MSTRAMPIGDGSSRTASIRSAMVVSMLAVEQRCQRVSTGRFDELDRLPADPRLRGTEDEEQEYGSDDGAADRHDDDLAPEVVHRAEDGFSVAPDADDGTNGAIGADRQILAQQ